MHNEVRSFIKSVRELYPGNFLFAKVQECGSMYINGTVRDYFYFCRYFGMDITQGKNVDFVCPAKNYKAPGYYDTVISTEMLEHDKDWQESLKQMYDNIRISGLLIITCAGPSRPEHGTKRTTPQDSPATTDYYRNISHEDFRSVLPVHLFDEYVLTYERGYQDLMFYGVKKDYLPFKNYEK